MWRSIGKSEKGNDSRNKHCKSNKETYYYYFNPENYQSHRFTIEFEPSQGKLPPGYGEKIIVKFMFLCTCRPDEIIDVMASERDTLDSEDAEHFPMRIDCASEPSIYLDYLEFEKDKLIGEGTFGLVYIGKYRGIDVAIKETKQFSWEDDVVKSFYQEVQMMDKMRSSYLINFVGAVETPQHYSIVTEYAKCGSLCDYWKGSLYTKVMAIKIFVDVAHGMNVLHSNHLIHRDIKSENILIASLSRDEQVNAKISDFGTSRTTTALTSPPRLWLV